jgi:hypothetical protein
MINFFVQSVKTQVEKGGCKWYKAKDHMREYKHCWKITKKEGADRIQKYNELCKLHGWEI